MQLIAPGVALPQSPRLRPLLNGRSLCSWLDISLRDIGPLIEGGQLGVAFDVRAPGARRKEPRVAGTNVLAVVSATPRAPEMSPKTVVESILPRREVLSTRDLRHILDVDHHTAQAIAIDLGPVRPAQRGVNGSALVLTSALRVWLLGRTL